MSTTRIDPVVGMRPRRALLIGRLLIVLAVLVLVGALAVFWGAR